ncbi:hypothetical protein CEUSTIGMA_g9260.t1 [Chlamydomonas eustigma]|uniref:Uncharacterized protein n=1 Tax=Chlamydomonas eustigma TaxID=1157962 RepID=A0A250XFY4_9CHLO|nr:hypothetical protein CEUSTIGMA_g9260.t1 [Chlamydomonas eustigma]|eukprot:GAX81832.1 hypothetical protein CEUSTIGMA_g9260.t1 [Chlamydomonas eustigma]
MSDTSTRTNAILKMLSIASTEASRLRTGAASSRDDDRAGDSLDLIEPFTPAEIAKPEVWNPCTEVSGERRASPVDKYDEQAATPRNILDSVLKAANGNVLAMLGDGHDLGAIQAAATCLITRMDRSLVMESSETSTMCRLDLNDKYTQCAVQTLALLPVVKASMQAGDAESLVSDWVVEGSNSGSTGFQSTHSGTQLSNTKSSCNLVRLLNNNDQTASMQLDQSSGDFLSGARHSTFILPPEVSVAQLNGHDSADGLSPASMQHHHVPLFQVSHYISPSSALTPIMPRPDVPQTSELTSVADGFMYQHTVPHVDTPFDITSEFNILTSSSFSQTASSLNKQSVQKDLLDEASGGWNLSATTAPSGHHQKSPSMELSLDDVEPTVRAPRSPQSGCDDNSFVLNRPASKQGLLLEGPTSGKSYISMDSGMLLGSPQHSLSRQQQQLFSKQMQSHRLKKSTFVCSTAHNGGQESVTQSATFSTTDDHPHAVGIMDQGTCSPSHTEDTLGSAMYFRLDLTESDSCSSSTCTATSGTAESRHVPGGTGCSSQPTFKGGSGLPSTRAINKKEKAVPAERGPLKSTLVRSSQASRGQQLRMETKQEVLERLKKVNEAFNRSHPGKETTSRHSAGNTKRRLPEGVHDINTVVADEAVKKPAVTEGSQTKAKTSRYLELISKVGRSQHLLMSRGGSPSSKAGTLQLYPIPYTQYPAKAGPQHYIHPPHYAANDVHHSSYYLTQDPQLRRQPTQQHDHYQGQQYYNDHVNNDSAADTFGRGCVRQYVEKECLQDSLVRPHLDNKSIATSSCEAGVGTREAAERPYHYDDSSNGSPRTSFFTLPSTAGTAGGYNCGQCTIDQPLRVPAGRPTNATCSGVRPAAAAAAPTATSSSSCDGRTSSSASLASKVQCLLASPPVAQQDDDRSTSHHAATCKSYKNKIVSTWGGPLYSPNSKHQHRHTAAVSTGATTMMHVVLPVQDSHMTCSAHHEHVPSKRAHHCSSTRRPAAAGGRVPPPAATHLITAGHPAAALAAMQRGGLQQGVPAAALAVATVVGRWGGVIAAPAVQLHQHRQQRRSGSAAAFARPAASSHQPPVVSTTTFSVKNHGSKRSSSAAAVMMTPKKCNTATATSSQPVASNKHYTGKHYTAVVELGAPNSSPWVVHRMQGKGKDSRWSSLAVVPGAPSAAAAETAAPAAATFSTAAVSLFSSPCHNGGGDASSRQKRTTSAGFKSTTPASSSCSVSVLKLSKMTSSPHKNITANRYGSSSHPHFLNESNGPSQKSSPVLCTSRNDGRQFAPSSEVVKKQVDFTTAQPGGVVLLPKSSSTALSIRSVHYEEEDLCTYQCEESETLVNSPSEPYQHLPAISRPSHSAATSRPDFSAIFQPSHSATSQPALSATSQHELQLQAPHSPASSSYGGHPSPWAVIMINENGRNDDDEAVQQLRRSCNRKSNYPQQHQHVHQHYDHNHNHRHNSSDCHPTEYIAHQCPADQTEDVKHYSAALLEETSDYSCSALCTADEDYESQQDRPVDSGRTRVMAAGLTPKDIKDAVNCSSGHLLPQPGDMTERDGDCDKSSNSIVMIMENHRGLLTMTPAADQVSTTMLLVAPKPTSIDPSLMMITCDGGPGTTNGIPADAMFTSSSTPVPPLEDITASDTTSHLTAHHKPSSTRQPEVSLSSALIQQTHSLPFQVGRYQEGIIMESDQQLLLQHQHLNNDDQEPEAQHGQQYDESPRTALPAIQDADNQEVIVEQSVKADSLTMLQLEEHQKQHQGRSCLLDCNEEEALDRAMQALEEELGLSPAIRSSETSNSVMDAMSHASVHHKRVGGGASSTTIQGSNYSSHTRAGSVGRGCNASARSHSKSARVSRPSRDSVDLPALPSAAPFINPPLSYRHLKQQHQLASMMYNSWDSQHQRATSQTTLSPASARNRAIIMPTATASASTANSSLFYSPRTATAVTSPRRLRPSSSLLGLTTPRAINSTMAHASAILLAGHHPPSPSRGHAAGGNNEVTVSDPTAPSGATLSAQQQQHVTVTDVMDPPDGPPKTPVAGGYASKLMALRSRINNNGHSPRTLHVHYHGGGGALNMVAAPLYHAGRSPDDGHIIGMEGTASTKLTSGWAVWGWRPRPSAVPAVQSLSHLEDGEVESGQVHYQGGVPGGQLQTQNENLEVMQRLSGSPSIQSSSTGIPHSLAEADAISSARYHGGPIQSSVRGSGLTSPFPVSIRRPSRTQTGHGAHFNFKKWFCMG